MSPKRIKALPDVPTFAELGYKIGVPTWLGYFAPKGVVPRIVKKFSDAVGKAIDDPIFTKHCDVLASSPSYMERTPSRVSF